MVGVYCPPASGRYAPSRNEVLAELKSLAQTAGAQVLGEVIQHKEHLDPAYYIGRGKAEEIANMVRDSGINVVIFDNDLSPAQVRNLESLFNTKVIDRSELILDIFATHARTGQAKLQVELAQLDYAFPRLKRLWTHLSRIEGGVGIGQRGPGEKQIEIDRRLAHKRITSLRKELKRLQARRYREALARAENINACLVGYTNAGKSTLMNLLTQTRQLVEDKLFSTLDTKTHLWKLPDGQKILLSDTVGFIRNLPHHLITSFHATLEETKQADFLLHIADGSHPEVAHQIEVVREVLHELGCVSMPTLLILNKIDQIDAFQRPVLEKQFPGSVFISALYRTGIEVLEEKISSLIETKQKELTFQVPLDNGSLIAYFREHSKVLAESYDDRYIQLRVRIGPRDAVIVKNRGAKETKSQIPSSPA